MADGEVSNQAVVSYHRRLDRTPEKNMNVSSDSVKIVRSEMRRALENVHNKLNCLRDDVDDRDKKIDEERKLRQAAEERLHAYLVDMYKDGEVNDELRQRLPRANKTDPLKDRSQDHTQEEEVKEVEEKLEAVATDTVEATCSPGMAAARGSDLDDLEKQIIQEGKLPISDLSNRMDSGQAVGHHGSNFTSPAQQVPPRPYIPYMGIPTASMYTPLSPYIPNYLNTSYQPGSFLSPPRYFGAGVRHPPSTMPQRHSPQNPGSANTSGETIDKPLNVSDLHSSPQGEADSGGDTSVPTLEGQAKDTPNTHPFRTSPFLSQPSQHFTPYMDQSYARFTSGLNMAGHLSSPMRTDDQAKQIAYLLAELDTEKVRNKRLVDKLADSEIELETARLTLKTSNNDQQSVTDASKAADLVQQVHTAQKKRDESSMNRIKVANQERDEALYRLRQAEQKLDDQGYGTPERSDNEEIDDDEDGVDQLLAKLGQIDMAGNMDRECSTLVQRLEMMKRRQQEITAEEMHVILEQRDAALAKAKRYEEELLRQQRQGADYNLKAKLAAVEQERDMALAQVRLLKDEIMTIRIYYSLHKSLSQDSRDQLNTFQNGDSKLGETTGDGRQKESNTSIAQLRAAEHENLQLEADLQKLEHAHEESQDKIVKLEKLVETLRRRLKAVGSESKEDDIH